MEFLNYLLEVSVLSLVFYSIYHFLFKRETFFRTNRYLLLSLLFVSFIIPAINIQVDSISGSGKLFQALPDLPSLIENNGESSRMARNAISWQVLIMAVYLTGMVFMLIRGLYNAYSLSLIRYNNPSLKKGKIRIIITDRIPSFSFFRWIFLQNDPGLHAGQNSVLEHEMAHARQFHSADLIALELAQAVLWFNPFIRMYKRSLLETHEYLADRVVLNSGTDLRDYIDTIAEEIMHNQSYKLASHFKSSTLKKRVIMATKKSSKAAGLKYLFILPALVFGLLSFSFNGINDTGQDKEKSNLPSIWPIEKSAITEVSNDYGGSGSEDHNGIDFAAKTGTPVVATASGVVKAAKEKGEYGNLVYLVHDDQIATLYAHLDKIEVKEGMKVKKGQVIGTVGNTGKSTSPHLHYEIRIDGNSVNPKKVMEKAKQMAMK